MNTSSCWTIKCGWQTDRHLREVTRSTTRCVSSSGQGILRGRSSTCACTHLEACMYGKIYAQVEYVGGENWQKLEGQPDQKVRSHRSQTHTHTSVCWRKLVRQPSASTYRRIRHPRVPVGCLFFSSRYRVLARAKADCLRWTFLAGFGV